MPTYACVRISLSKSRFDNRRRQSRTPMFALLLATLVSILLCCLLLQLRRPKNYPPGPQWLPFIGNTTQLRRAARTLSGQHLVFEQWMADYNSPILGLKLGSELVVVALTYPLVRAVHTGPEYDGRPDNFFLRMRTMGSRLGITFTDGDLWLEQRNFATRHLRAAGYGRQPMQVQIQNELNELLQVIADQQGDAVWPGSFLPPSVLNVLWTFTAGQKIARNDPRLARLLSLMQLRSKAFDMSGGVLNQMAWLRHIAPEWTGYNLIRRFNEEIHAFFMDIIAQHKLDFDEDKASDDLIYAYLNEMQAHAGDPETTFSDRQLTMVILDMFIAGSQTTSITLDLALMTMALHPDVQRRVHDELKRLALPTIGSAENSTQSPCAEDRAQLPYTEAVLLEVQRFYHIVPISGPRRVLHDTMLGGYRIPRDTTVLMGLRSVHMDDEHWGDPECFRPERFLDADGVKLVNTERLMPFGQGRRRCLGESLARACLFTFFAGMMNRFAVQLTGNDADRPERKLLPGITLSPKPYKVVFKARV